MGINRRIQVVMDLLPNKRCREAFCKNYIEENPMLSPLIINYWSLNRVQNKYVNKTRLYTENSYSKKKIREEEMIFIRKSSLFQPLRFSFEQQWILSKRLFPEKSKYASTEQDYRFYLQTVVFKSKRFPITENIQIFVKKNNNYRVDLMKEVVEISVVRERIMEEYLETCKELSDYIIYNFQLKLCIEKYIQKISFANKSSYIKNKLKEEEIFFIKKIFQYTIWLQEIQKFDSIQKLVLDDFIIENEPKTYNENIKFLKKLTVQILEEFFSEEMMIDDDVASLFTESLKKKEEN